METNGNPVEVFDRGVRNYSRLDKQPRATMHFAPHQQSMLRNTVEKDGKDFDTEKFGPIAFLAIKPSINAKI